MPGSPEGTISGSDSGSNGVLVILQHTPGVGEGNALPPLGLGAAVRPRAQTTHRWLTSCMSLVTWQDLCLDALDVGVMSDFWSAVSGLDLADPEPPARLDGPTSRHTVWVNQVDRPRRAKNRVHLDVDCATVDDLVALGATVTAAAAETGLGWTRMADPEGNDFCAFVRRPDRVPAYRLHGIGIDCRDAEAQARWWGDLFGAEPDYAAEHDCWTLTGIAVDERMTLDFAPVPEPRHRAQPCSLGRPRETPQP